MISYTGKEVQDIIDRHKEERRSGAMFALGAVAIAAFVAGLITGLLS